MDSSILRILDANFNRAREALRVIEDYVRFVLNEQQTCAALKQLRHDLSAAATCFAPDAIVYRDTPGDIGTATKATDELHRQDAADVVIAAGKRLGEALRSIEEYLKISDPAQAAEVESIRYRFYELEQRVACMLRPARKQLEQVRLCVLISEKFCKHPWLQAAEQAIEGGADMLQLREKQLDDAQLLSRARQLAELCHKRNILCIINDRPDIAVLSGADGVHVGQTDLPAAQVRKLVGRRMIIGVSTHDLSQAQQALRDGADYIGVGPVFPSSTKPRDFLPGLDFVRLIAEARLPVPAIAIAGITAENVDEVLAAGIRAIAVTAAVVGAQDVRSAARQLKEKLLQQ